MLPVPSSPRGRRSPSDAPLATKVQGDTFIALPRDIISEILSRLPVKSLCLFRCTSKAWCTLISKHRPHDEPLIVASYLEKSCVRLIDMEGNVVRMIRGVGSFKKSICSRADDLVCVMQGLCDAKVIDLATGEVLVTCSGGPALGFGRAVPSGLYKLLFFRYGKCVILTVGDPAGWRKKPLSSTLIASYKDTITINGVVYLFVHNVIVRFDLESEAWRKGIKAPPSIPNEPRIKVRLSELGGSLCVGTTDSYTYNGWDIWRLADSVNSIWVKAYSISSRYSELMPLKVIPNSNKLFFYGHQGRPILQIYDPDDGTYTEVPKMPEDYTWSISLCRGVLLSTDNLSWSK